MTRRKRGKAQWERPLPEITTVSRAPAPGAADFIPGRRALRRDAREQAYADLDHQFAGRPHATVVGDSGRTPNGRRFSLGMRTSMAGSGEVAGRDFSLTREVPKPKGPGPKIPRGGASIGAQGDMYVRRADAPLDLLRSEGVGIGASPDRDRADIEAGHRWEQRQKDFAASIAAAGEIHSSDEE